METSPTPGGASRLGLSAFAQAVTNYPQSFALNASRVSRTPALLVTENGWPLTHSTIPSVVPQAIGRDWFGVALHDASTNGKIATQIPDTFLRVRTINPYDVRPSRLAWLKKRRSDVEADVTFRGLAGLLTTLCEDRPNHAALAEAFAWCRNHPGAIGAAFVDPLNDEGFIEGTRIINRDVIDLTDSATAAGQDGLISDQSPSATVEGLAHLARLLHGVAALAAQSIAATDHVVVIGNTWANVVGFTMQTMYGATVRRVETQQSLNGPTPTDPYGKWLEQRLNRGLASLLATTPQIIELQSVEGNVAVRAGDATATTPSN
jgi:hypothetical protein